MPLITRKSLLVVLIASVATDYLVRHLAYFVGINSQAYKIANLLEVKTSEAVSLLILAQDIIAYFLLAIILGGCVGFFTTGNKHFISILYITVSIVVIFIVAMFYGVKIVQFADLITTSYIVAFFLFCFPSVWLGRFIYGKFNKHATHT